MPLRPQVPPDALAVWLPTLLAGILYLAGLDRWPLTDAEAWTREVALKPVAELLADVIADRHPPLYFLLEAALVRVRDSDALMRLPSALAGVATVFVAARLTLRTGGPGAAWLTGLALATSPFLMVYAATARSGALTALVGVGALSAGVSLAEGNVAKPEVELSRGGGEAGLARSSPPPRNNRRAAIPLALALSVGLYLHYGVAHALVGAALTAVLGPLVARGVDRRLALVGLGACILAAAPLLPWALGPGLSQVEHSPEVGGTLAVYRYLLWPVGPHWIPRGAWVVTVLAGVGALTRLARPTERAAVLGWSIAAAAMPWVLADYVSLQHKAYVLACLLPFWAWLVGGLGRWRPLGVVGCVIVLAVQVPGLAHLWELQASIANLAPRTVGTHDPRREVRVLTAAGRATGRTASLETRGGREWLRYGPDLAHLSDVWPAEDKSTRRAVEPLRGVQRSERLTPCRFSHAFTVEVMVPDDADCAVLLGALREEAAGFGPFELELAVQARASGDPAAAETWARAAVGHSPGSGEAEEVLAGWLLVAGQAEEALALVDRGAEKAAAHGRRDEWRALETLRAKVLTRLGRKEEARAAKARETCIREAEDPWVARECVE